MSHPTDGGGTAAVLDARPGPAARVLLAVVRAYQRWVSPLLGPHCRFSPTCSAYAAQALASHGALRGSWLTARRVLRCQPFSPGGHDPVPPVGPSCGTMQSRTPPRTSRRPRRTGADPC